MGSKEQIFLDRIIGVVNRTAPDAELYLYGSRARQNAEKFSDWDLLILLNAKKVSFGFETKFMDEFYDLEVETGEIISPLIYTKSDWDENHSITPLFENIQREGIRIK
jgi:predicted nucleotidyltransferase